MREFIESFPDKLLKSKIILKLNELQNNGIRILGNNVDPELLKKVFQEASKISANLLKHQQDVENWQDLNLRNFEEIHQKVS